MDQEKKFRNLYNNASDMYASVDPDSRTIVECNDTLAKMTGYTRAEIIGRPLQFIYHPTCLPEVVQVIQAYDTNGFVKNVELALQHKNGSTIPVLLSLSAIKNDEGKVLYSSCCWRDISDLKIAQAKLTTFTFFFENSLDICAVANDAGYFTLVNDTFSQTLGYSKEEIYSTSFVDWIHPDDLASTLAVYEKAVAGKSLFNFVNRYRKKDGSYIYMDWNCSTNSSTGEINCIARDITERVLAEEQLLAVNKELEAFSYSVAHDLRAPLRAILGFSEILKQDHADKLNAEAIQYLERISVNSSSMSALIDDLLDFSRLGRKEVRKTTVDMNRLTKYVLKNLEKETPPNASISLQQLHSTSGDESLLVYVLQNIISNALKYSSKRAQPTIVISSEDKQHKTVYSVRDNGAGFDMQYAKKLFEVFQRLHNSSEYGGTGIGLALAQRIIEKHGGDIWAEAIIDQGATFYFSLPK